LLYEASIHDNAESLDNESRSQIRDRSGDRSDNRSGARSRDSSRDMSRKRSIDKSRDGSLFLSLSLSLPRRTEHIGPDSILAALPEQGTCTESNNENDSFIEYESDPLQKKPNCDSLLRGAEEGIIFYGAGKLKLGLGLGLLTVR
jgi:hypothetical protein